MIALLRGEVADRRDGSVLLVCGGVGYTVGVSSQTLLAVPEQGETATLHTHLVVRDDALSLYGFHSERERELFLLLTGVQSVGPKLALAILSSGPPADLLAAIAGEDTDRLQAVPGVGKRTAERIMVELRERILAAGHTPSEGADGFSQARLAREALLGLGYTAGEADEMLHGVSGETAGEIIQNALRSTHAAA